jgi:hypothetical protein
VRQRAVKVGALGGGASFGRRILGECINRL